MPNKEEKNHLHLNSETPKNPKILITGANGFTGRHACKYFMDANYHVIAVTRKATDQISDRLISYEHCELTDKQAVISLIQRTKPDFLLHLAGQNHVEKSWKDPLGSLEANVLSTAYLLEALRIEDVPCKIIVVGSTLQFNPNDLSSLHHPYSLTKTLQALISQSWERLYGMNVILAKPSNLIGPGVSTGVCSILAKKVIDMEFNNAEKNLNISNLHVRRDFLDVRDAVVAYDILFEKGISGIEYIISSGKFMYLKDLTDALRLYSSVEFGLRTLNNHIEVVDPLKPTLMKKLGWKPQITFEESIKDILLYYRDLESGF
ncbi:NAD-dependent epimerase/dehydratase family protein [Paenisporosarcina sp. NPDC076907]|uniref:NAD-dependent epimerase/dehydratase family protein n=1 Tax=Paenisporosarcina sp. NPDC076907 TaxID=3390604 RepID=UPI003D0839BD